jgi:Domain of unknown function (DUF3291)
MTYHLAQVNIAKMLAPIDSPVMADFAANLDPINALAERSEGFVWRLKEDNNNATSIKVYDDDFIIVNMSVWESVDHLYTYAYRTDHVQYIGRRKEWFERMSEHHMALWYVPQGEYPTVADAVARLNYLRQNGETPFAFTFKKRFGVDDSVGFISET